ncbi:DUF202 domain-containing protein [Nocardia rhizosphaerae]|uniref:DUF202 domain-containing protein n=1 Tax=Nocardia rhizosphaerae TaxID=1691571 RepID=A0ABV8L6X2_9NOCA
MTAPTLAAERTALAWRRTALGAAACALLFVHAVTLDDWPTLALPLTAAAIALLLSVIGWARGRALHHGRVSTGRVLVPLTTCAVVAVAAIAIGTLLIDRLST